MGLIDDKGKLFGKVNVIDLSVVLVILLLLVVGLKFFVFQEEKTALVEILMEKQPLRVAQSILPGDVEMDGDKVIAEVLSVDASPSSYRDDRAAQFEYDVFILVRLTVKEKGDGLFFKGTPVKTAKDIELQTNKTNINGRILSLGNTSSTQSTDLLLRVDNLPAALAAQVTQGLVEQDVLGKSVAEIRSVSSTPRGNLVDLALKIHLDARSRDGVLYFKNQELKAGNTLRLRTGAINLMGTIVQFGSISAQHQTFTVNVKVANVAPWVADALAEGSKEFSGDVMVAEIQQKEVRPAEVITYAQDGSIFKKEHPVNKDVFLTLKVNAVLYASEPFYKDAALQVGNQLPLTFGDVSIWGDVMQIA
ncbi:DUF4330 domain-containing protein [Candidatus Woesearchaeota archaeon]|nr:DUF4330 domain-containing protein [Candidatus Woesearchaeota archaeon]